ncbi:hypothetical protein Tco_0657878 [Tanacetum coccineum]
MVVLFIVNLYHDGVFHVKPLEYVNGDCNVIDDVDFDVHPKKCLIDSHSHVDTNHPLDDVAHIADFKHEFEDGCCPNINNSTLRSENKLVHLEQPLMPLPLPVASQVARDAYDTLFDAQNKVACLMLGSMSFDLQRDLENYKAYDMIQELKTMFEEQAKQELFKIVKAFHA